MPKPHSDSTSLAGFSMSTVAAFWMPWAMDFQSCLILCAATTDSSIGFMILRTSAISIL